MPLFSAFTPFGMWKFSGAPSRGESIYRSMAAAKVNAFDLTPGTYQEGKVYAQSMAIARGRYALERAQNQLDPFKCIELLPKLEKDWAIVPLETDTLLTRQANLAAKMILVRGARREAVEAGLRSLLGSHFIALRNVALSEILSSTSPAQNFARPELPAKYIRLTTPVALTNAAYEVGYTTADPSATPVTIIKGDVLTMSPDNMGLKEPVTVSSARDGYFTATFLKAHDIGSIATTDNYVDWMSTQRMLYVVVDDYAARNAELCRRVNDFMGRVSRGVTNWHIVEPTTGGATTMGPFTLNVSPLGAVPIGTLSINYTDGPEYALLPDPGTANAILSGRRLTGLSLVRVNAVSKPFVLIDDYHATVTTTIPAPPYTLEVTTPSGVFLRTVTV